MSLMQRIYTPDGFRRAMAQASPKAFRNTDIVIQAGMIAAVEKAEGERRMQFTISTPTIDRMSDTIALDGWKLDNFRANPVVLYGHDSSALPVGKARRVWVESNALKAEVEFTPEGVARFNDTVYEMLKGGFLNAVSVGFSPLKWAWSKAPDRPMGIDFIEQELLEFSIVTIPANPEALIEDGTRSIDPADADTDEPDNDDNLNADPGAVEREALNARIAIERLRA